MDGANIASSQIFPQDVEQKLVDCKNCGRHFAADRIETHECICQKQKKRKPFDVCQQRVKGTDAEKFYKKNKARTKSEWPTVCNSRQTSPTVDNPNSRLRLIHSTPAVPIKESSPAPQKNWRKQHEELILSMKAAREVTAMLKKGGNLRDLPPPPPSDYSDYVQCPTCLRKFNSGAAQRHIPKCAEMQLNKPKPPAQKTPLKATGLRRH